MYLYIQEEVSSYESGSNSYTDAIKYWYINVCARYEYIDLFAVLYLPTAFLVPPPTLRRRLLATATVPTALPEHNDILQAYYTIVFCQEEKSYLSLHSYIYIEYYALAISFLQSLDTFYDALGTFFMYYYEFFFLEPFIVLLTFIEAPLLVEDEYMCTGFSYISYDFEVLNFCVLNSYYTTARYSMTSYLYTHILPFLGAMAPTVKQSSLINTLEFVYFDFIIMLEVVDNKDVLLYMDIPVVEFGSRIKKQTFEQRIRMYTRIEKRVQRAKDKEARIVRIKKTNETLLAVMQQTQLITLTHVHRPVKAIFTLYVLLDEGEALCAYGTFSY